MKKRVDIYLNKKDIEDGIRFSSIACPVAAAVRRKLRVPVKVDTYIMFINSRKVTVPPAVRIFIMKFDAYKNVKPFSFSLYL